MKIHKMVCLDSDVVEAIKNENVSSLVNRLLKEHIKANINPYANLTKEQLALREKMIEIRLKAEEKIKELQDGV